MSYLTHLHVEGAMRNMDLSSDPYLAILGPNNLAPLEDLFLYLCDEDELNVSTGFANLRTERLRRLFIMCIQHDWCPEVLKLVSRSFLVEDLDLRIDFLDTPTHVVPFVLDKLRRFTSGGSHPCAFLRIIRMPLLQVLRLDGENVVPGDLRRSINGATFSYLRSLTFTYYPFEDSDVLPLRHFLQEHPTIEEITVKDCGQHELIMLSMLGPVDQDGTAFDFPELDVFDWGDEPENDQKRMLPKLKMLHFDRFVPGYATSAIFEAVFSQVLSVWGSLHIIVDSSGTPDGKEAYWRMMRGLYEGRFTYHQFPGRAGAG